MNTGSAFRAGKSSRMSLMPHLEDLRMLRSYPGLLTDLPEMLSYSALLVELRGSGPGVTLSATEAANLYAYIASERRVVIFGENHNWDS
jgi:hypothetical protein